MTTFNLVYRDSGAGEALVLIHGGMLRDAFLPMLGQPALVRHSRLVSYHRAGYGASPRHPAGTSIQAQADDCQTLMRHLGIGQAHVVAYSFGGPIALQLALDSPNLVRSLSLFEPLVPSALTRPETVQFFVDVAQRAVAAYAGGDAAGAIDIFAQGAFGPDYRGRLERALPNAFRHMVEDAEVQFQAELPALQQWQFGPAEAARLNQPVLSVSHADPRWDGFRQTADSLQAWLPTVETCTLPVDSHLLQVLAPEAAANLVASFVQRHPLVGQAEPARDAAEVR